MLIIAAAACVMNHVMHYEVKHTCQYVCAFSAGAAPDSDGTVVRCARKQLTIPGEYT